MNRISNEQSELVIDRGFNLQLHEVQHENEIFTVSSMAYYTIAMVVMFALFTVQFLVVEAMKQKKSGIYYRIQTSSLSPVTYLISKLFSFIVIIIMQMIILIMTTSIITNIDWMNIPYILLVTGVYAFALGSLTFFLSVYINNEKLFSSIWTSIVFILSFLGG